MEKRNVSAKYILVLNIGRNSIGHSIESLYKKMGIALERNLYLFHRVVNHNIKLVRFSTGEAQLDPRVTI